jgi:hypothetical protein
MNVVGSTDLIDAATADDVHSQEIPILLAQLCHGMSKGVREWHVKSCASQSGLGSKRLLGKALTQVGLSIRSDAGGSMAIEREAGCCDPQPSLQRALPSVITHLRVRADKQLLPKLLESLSDELTIAMDA